MSIQKWGIPLRTPAHWNTIRNEETKKQRKRKRRWECKSGKKEWKKLKSLLKLWKYNENTYIPPQKAQLKSSKINEIKITKLRHTIIKPL